MNSDFYSGIFSTHEEADDIEGLLAGKDDMEYVKVSVAFLKQTALRIRQLEADVRKYEESSM
jgi:hypothetical protein